jgi:uncharacterized protein (DUF849 family)
MTGTLITVAPTGAESAKSDVPALPVTLAELVLAAKECQAVGASVIHVHIRDDEARPSLDPARLRDTVAALRESTDLIVQLSTGGAVTDPEDARLAVLDAGPEMASCTMGTVNFGDDVFLNRWLFVVDLHTRMQERGVVPEYEIFDLGHLAALRDLPAGTTFSATGIGRTTLPVLLASLAAGGHLRVGMEDTIAYAKGQPVESNAQLVARAAGVARIAQRPPLTPAEARALLGVAPR